MKHLFDSELSDRIFKEHQAAERMAWKLEAWGVLLENQPDCEGYRELQGLGLCLRSYARRLEQMVRRLDLVSIELTTKKREEL